MTRQKLLSDIEAGRVSGAYLFHGPEEYLKREALELMRAKLLPPGLEALNESVLETADAARIIESAETLPVMCDRRLVVVKDWPPLMGADRADGNGAEPQKNDPKNENAGKSKKNDSKSEELARMARWIPTAPDTCVVVFTVHGEVSGSRLRAFNAETRAVSFAYLQGAELAEWLRGQFAQRGKKLAADAVQALMSLAGGDLTRLSGEVEKLAAYAGTEKTVTAAHVNACVTPDAESNVFKMIDALLRKDARTAFDILNAMTDAGEPAARVFYMLTRQMRLMTHMSLLQSRRKPLPEIERILDIHGYALQAISRQAARIPSARVEQCYRRCVEYETAVRDGTLRDRAALEQMMILIHAIS